ncbi:protein SIEVE ELEMENT OCCLUSION B-like [Corylus avellana]|uniref:protein SIEVE ELEMENT OCCLUSION B-like n=1 Tax=Corylus avellana TaxID=13451 RepID=UPI00286AA4EA|nr:protein SIEVE ELEMENT OCCLUSION B-like [Corylus avellana]
MACKALCAETAHKRTILILNKLSSYSWEAKAVLALAAFALNYKYFSVPAQLHSSRQVEIPKHVPATLKHLDLPKCKETISELNTMINDVLDFSESVFELKKLSTNNYIEDKPCSYILGRISFCVYGIIISVVACTTQMCCLTSDEDKTQDLYLLAEEISDWHSELEGCILDEQFRIVEKKAERKLKELLHTPDEIVEVFKGLIFAKDDKQSLFDGSTKEMVSVDVLEKKNVLLFISGLNISSDDISTLISIYIGIRKKKDTFKIVWIPIVEQWTYQLRMKFEMLRSDMPWYIMQYFSLVAGIKFIKEDWHFDNEPIIVVMNSQGDVKNKDALGLIREWGMNAFPFTPPKPVPRAGFVNPRRPHQVMSSLLL